MKYNSTLSACIPGVACRCVAIESEPMNSPNSLASAISIDTVESVAVKGFCVGP